MARIWRKSSAEEYNKAIKKEDPDHLFLTEVTTLSRGSCFYCGKTFRLTKGYWIFLTNHTAEPDMLGKLGYFVVCSEKCFNICVLINKSGFFR